MAGPDTIAALEHTAEQVAVGLTHEPAWPTLRVHLLLAAADGADPTAQLTAAAAAREPDTATDRAALLDTRLDAQNGTVSGPLPWLPAVPARLAHDPQWAPTWAADQGWSPTWQTRFATTRQTSDRPS